MPPSNYCPGVTEEVSMAQWKLLENLVFIFTLHLSCWLTFSNFLN